MSVVECEITRNGVRIQESKRWAQTYSARYRIITDVPLGPIAVQTASRIYGNTPVPYKGDAYNVHGEIDPASFALDFSWELDPQNRNRWYCDVVWRPPDPREIVANYTQPNPLQRTVIKWIDFEETTEVVQEAKNITNLGHLNPPRPVGTLGPIVNTAGQLFDDFRERPDARPVLIIQRNYPSLASIIALHNTYYRKLNQDVYEGAAAKTLWVRRITASPPIFENGFQYFQGTIHIAYDPRGWKHRIVNRGLAYLEAGKLIDFDKGAGAAAGTGHNFSEPILLNSTGGRLPPGASSGITVEYEWGDTTSFANIEQVPPP